MFPSFFISETFGISIYALFWALGYMLSLLLTIKLNQKAKPFSVGQIQFVFLFSTILGLVGARVTFYGLNPDQFSNHPLRLLQLDSGGLVFLGGFLLALLGNILLFRLWKIPINSSLDLLAPGLALGHAFGRIGCLMAGCCFGKICDLPWAIHLHGRWVHPVQIYETIGLLFLSLFLFKKHIKEVRGGLVWPLYLSGYGALRFLTEIFRDDQIRGAQWLGALSFSQVISGLLFLIGVWFLIRGLRRNH